MALSLPVQCTAPMRAQEFQRAVLGWHERHGRKDLPWRRHITAYRVWVSEVMLQQTRVATARAYFERFVGALPHVGALAAASEDQVLHLWAGLGYYRRARHMRAAAGRVVAEYGGRFPDSIERLSALPGIGRSTAGALRSIAFDKPAAVLDGNVQRVLARFYAIGGWPGTAAVRRRLWAEAEALVPELRCREYSQALMDLGATVCGSRAPQCGRCPLASGCQARASGHVLEFPGRRPRKPLPVRSTVMLLAATPEGEVALEKRPGTGIWAGLWSFPEFASAEAALAFCRARFGGAGDVRPLARFRHTFSHYHLDIQPLLVSLERRRHGVMAADRGLWYNLRKPVPLGLPRPAAKLLKLLEEQV